MKKITDININEAIIHIVKENGDSIPSNYNLELTETVYKYIYKHLEKCAKSKKLRAARFNTDIKSQAIEGIYQYLNGELNNIVDMSKKLCEKLATIASYNNRFTSCGLLVCALTTDIGPAIAILELDYVKSFKESTDNLSSGYQNNILIDENLLPSGKAINKAAFILPKNRTDGEEDLYVIENVKKLKDDYGLYYWSENFLNCFTIRTDEENTLAFINGTNSFLDCNHSEDVILLKALKERIPQMLIEGGVINLKKVALGYKCVCTNFDVEHYMKFMSDKCPNTFKIDKEVAAEKLQTVKVNINDSDIKLQLPRGLYSNKEKIDLVRNSDGSVDLVIKNVKNIIGD